MFPCAGGAWERSILDTSWRFICGPSSWILSTVLQLWTRSDVEKLVFERWSLGSRCGRDRVRNTLSQGVHGAVISSFCLGNWYSCSKGVIISNLKLANSQNITQVRWRSSISVREESAFPNQRNSEKHANPEGGVIITKTQFRPMRSAFILCRRGKAGGGCKLVSLRVWEIRAWVTCKRCEICTN